MDRCCKGSVCSESQSKNACDRIHLSSRLSSMKKTLKENQRQRTVHRNACHPAEIKSWDEIKMHRSKIETIETIETNKAIRVQGVQLLSFIGRLFEHRKHGNAHLEEARTTVRVKVKSSPTSLRRRRT